MFRAVSLRLTNCVIPAKAKAGIHSSTARASEKWVPAFAGTTT